MIKMNSLGLFIALFVAVHNSGVISGQFMNSGAVKCGGQICKPITGVFTKSPLPSGYVDIATIPAGASNISVTELKHSSNFLVLKAADGRFIINGDYTVSLSGLYEAAGTVFDYRRLDGLTNSSSKHERPIEGVTEWITCTGPTYEPIYLMVLSQQPNPGVKFEYLVPIQPTAMTNSEEDSGNESGETSSKQGLKAADTNLVVTNRPPHRRRRFAWKIVGFSACSKTCGGGVQSPIIKCIRENPTRVFNSKRCSHLKQPTVNENQLKCNTQPCPAYWKLSEWTDCRCGQYNEEEWRSREVKCVQELVSGIVIQVNHAACVEDEPKGRQQCDCQKKRADTKPINDLGIIRNKNRKRVEETRKHGLWLMAQWSEECSAVCGMGLQFRSIFCDRASAPNSERCDLRLTPETSRECSSNEKCAFGEWFTGPWSKCSGECFNLTKGRSIVCIKNDAFAPDEDCNGDEKPASVDKCQMKEVDYCKPKWHYAEWTDCNKKCGGGTQRRTVKCVEPNEVEELYKESVNCKYSEREIAYRSCNEEKCSEAATTTEPYFDPRVDMIQNDSNCVDDFPNCHLVIKAKLCSYSYYTNHCCQSCRIQSNELY